MGPAANYNFGTGLTSGVRNILVGYLAGIGITTGSDNTFLGSNTTGVNNLTNATAIGANAAVSLSNSLVLGNNANVGIGTSTPTSKLEVRTPGGRFGIVHTDGTVRVGTGVVEGGTFGTISDHLLFFFTNDIRRMSISNTGNVGVGTNTPASKFTVVGLIGTTTSGVKFPDGTIQTTAGGGSAGTVILNQTTQQTGASFNVDGTGTANILNATSHYNLGASRILRAPGTNNLFVGLGAGENYTNSASTHENTFFGSAAGQMNSTGGRNTFVGAGAGLSNMSGAFKAFFGDDAGRNNTANQNAFFGSGAGERNTSGERNAFFGTVAGNLNQTGEKNSFFGSGAGNQNQMSRNSFFGFEAGANNLIGENNTFLGERAGVGNESGSNNTFVGRTAGAATILTGNVSGSNNTLIGANADDATDSLPNAAAIGANAQVSQNNSLVLGSINGVNNATADTKVGIGTTAPKAKLDVTGGNILVGPPGQGIILKSPNGATCKLLSIDNAGAMALTTVACP